MRCVCRDPLPKSSLSIFGYQAIINNLMQSGSQQSEDEVFWKISCLGKKRFSCSPKPGMVTRISDLGLEMISRLKL